MSFLYEIQGEGADAFYTPSIFGYGLIVCVMLGLLLMISFVSGKKKINTKQLVFCAVGLALAAVLSMVKLFKMPMGGSVTLFSMFFVTVLGYWFGVKIGVIAAIAYGFLQLLLDPYIIHPLQLCMDYIFAFGALGLSGVFSDRKNGLILGYWLALCGRFVFSFLSGMIFFASAAESYNMFLPLYSALYNGGYIVAEGVLTTVFLLLPPVKKGLSKVKNM